jgi:hypothetical protein
MFPETKCEHCPLIARGDMRTCLAQTTKHARYCHHAEQGNQGYIDILLGEHPVIEMSHTIMNEPSFPLGRLPGNGLANQERTNDMNELNRIKSCRFLTQCGCGAKKLGDCSLGLGNNGSVRVADCRDCSKWESR